MNIPRYPVDFNDSIRNKKTTEEGLNGKINSEIESMIEFMNRNNTNNHSVAFEDILIIIDRIYEDDDSYFEISVAKQHSRGIVR
ncbi:hypothetical protein [Halalkalibacter akibai]|uniref:Uncharacterized protein n=1 Tax=Halalkalibacter akibai (strain ATCC 43226 / DSM 21942 / CIP 109018 / JCM 9157 / 1139) TaxID=1236973 RepID=W4QWP8_HALA3|nr:hypothetical protein [Halalkalibacter akibai]GAE36511.1 hypothetical protein JCM9157_3704 [Halalkalibacter akibai JCM 9157]